MESHATLGRRKSWLKSGGPTPSSAQLAATGSKFEEVIRSEKRFDEVTKRPYLEARKVLRPAYEARETASHYARQYIGKNDELFNTLNAQLHDALAMEGYFA